MKAALLSAGAAIVSLSTSMAMLPGAAQANGVGDAAVYSAVYNPVLDGDNRSCEIINTGHQGSLTGTGPQGQEFEGLNSLTGSKNTSVMRTIGQDPGSAGSTAGIQFNMVGANIVTLEGSKMYIYQNNQDAPSNGGSIKLDIPRAKVSINKEGAIGSDLGFDYEVGARSDVAEVTFNNGLADKDKTGSIITGKTLNLENADSSKTAVIEELAEYRQSGNRAGIVTFRLDDIDDIGPGQTIVMETTISCEPVPVLRYTAKGKIIPFN